MFFLQLMQVLLIIFHLKVTFRRIPARNATVGKAIHSDVFTILSNDLSYV